MIILYLSFFLPVPLGFIYTQLPHQDPPTTLWPSTQWVDVSSNYSGLFFRVNGGNATEFGDVQEADSPRLKNVNILYTTSTTPDDIEVPADGSWSPYIYSGSASGGPYNMRFQHSTVEVRPRNQAIRLWKRIK